MDKILEVKEPFILGKCACGCGEDIPLRTKRGYLAKYKNGHSKPKAKYNCNKCKDQRWMIECACGCGQHLFLRDKFYEIRNFINGHHMKIRDQTGEKNANYKGGETIRKDTDYVSVRLPNHPYQSNGYVKKHRAIMEHYYSIIFDEEIYLPPNLQIHHIDGNPKNNSLINLELLTPTAHTTLHNEVDMDGRLCSNPNCPDPTNPSFKIRNGKKRRDWSGDGKGGWLCRRCYLRKNWYKYKDRRKNKK